MTSDQQSKWETEMRDALMAAARSVAKRARKTDGVDLFLYIDFSVYEQNPCEQGPPTLELSDQDRRFLASLRISVGEETL